MSSRNDLLQAYIAILNEIIKSSGNQLASRECNTTSDEELLTKFKDTYKEFIDIKNKVPESRLKNVSYDESVTKLTGFYTAAYKSDQDSDGKEILEENKLQVLCLIIGTFIINKPSYQISILQFLRYDLEIGSDFDEKFEVTLWSYHPIALTAGNIKVKPATKKLPEETTIIPRPYQPPTLKGDDENPSVARTQDPHQKAAASPATVTKEGSTGSISSTKSVLSDSNPLYTPLLKEADREKMPSETTTKCQEETRSYEPPAFTICNS